VTRTGGKRHVDLNLAELFLVRERAGVGHERFTSRRAATFFAKTKGRALGVRKPFCC